MECAKLPWMIDFHSTHNGTILKQQFESAFARDNLDHLCKINLDSETSKKRLCGILCSVGANSNPDTLERMLEAGMSIAIIKLAHCNLDQAKELIQTLRKSVMNYSMKIGRVYALGIGIDIKGPEIRTGLFKEYDSKEIQLNEGDMTNLTNDPMYEEFVTKDMIYVNIKDMREVSPGDKIHISNTANGQVSLSAQKIVGSIIRCLIENTGKIANKASVSLEATIRLTAITKEDEEAIKFASTERASFIFVPYAEQADTIKEVKKMLGKSGRSIMVVAKIESAGGVYNIDSLIEVSDGILISRCALANELSPEKVAVVQKMIIGKCNMKGIPVILAPSVLQSMVSESNPNISEITDVTSAITDGVDCLMLSRETAVGSFPIDSIRALDAICRNAEPLVYQTRTFNDLTRTFIPVEPIYAIAISAVEASMKCNAAAILTNTVTGRTAKLLSRFRPRCPIVAITRYAHVSRFLSLWRGVDPVHYIKKADAEWIKDVERRIQFGLTYGKASGYIRAGDALIILTGSKSGTGFTNALRVVFASDYDTEK